MSAGTMSARRANVADAAASAAIVCDRMGETSLVPAMSRHGAGGWLPGIARDRLR